MSHLIRWQPKLGLARGVLAKLRMFLARLGLGNYDMAALEDPLIRAARATSTGGNHNAAAAVLDALENAAIGAIGRRPNPGSVGGFLARTRTVDTWKAFAAKTGQVSLGRRFWEKHGI